ncbi:MAG: transglutaminase family protein [Verrucomicrobia bacterium]|nr:transglutaminase family protein [Verrucomicrobiota bacterium]
MLIKIGYDIALNLQLPTAVIYLLRVHPERESDLAGPERFRIEPEAPIEHYIDMFGNHCGRVNSPAGTLRFVNEAIIRDSGEPDLHVPDAVQHDVRELPVQTLAFLLPSRYCEVDSELLDFAWQNFASVPPGWTRVQAVVDFVHNHLKFDYLQARPTRTALDAFREKVGVCRDFTHLSVTLCRCLNIPARYVTGYLGDIGVPPAPDPMDFSAWFEVFLGGRWYTFDARHNRRRIGRIVIGRGRDAGDVPITMVFGRHRLEGFTVITEEVKEPSLDAAPVASV